MKIIYSLKKKIYLYLVYLIISIGFCSNNYISFIININFNETEIEIYNIKDGGYYDDFCQKWTPSLFSPILLIPRDFNSKYLVDINRDLKIEIPTLSFREIFSIRLYNFIFFGRYNVTLGRAKFSRIVTNCYLGLSPRIDNNSGFMEEDNLLIKLHKNGEIDKKIFSFNNWTLYPDSIQSNLYLGDIHEHFRLKNGNIGSCNNIMNSPYWGCYFSAIKFNDNIIQLINENGELYKIFFSSENYDIIIPKSFEEKYNMITNNQCAYFDELEGSYLLCENLFNEHQKYIPITLINNNISITIEIDHINRFTTSIDEKRGNVRIKFSEVDYFILPLIMFKNFHVQFDAENDVISFYTTDKSILKVKEEGTKPNNNRISKVLIVFIVILIVLFISIIGLVVYRYIRIKKESKIQNDVKKIEDIEEFHNMN